MTIRAWTLTAIFMALHVSAFAVEEGSVLGGATSGFLKKENSPYLVKETIVIPEDKALVVEAGVELRFNEGTGLDIRGGSMVVMGESSDPVTFSGANGVWNGVSVTGLKRSEVQGLRLTNAEYGFVVESGALELRGVTLDGVEKAALYVRNGSVDVQWSKISNSKNIGLWATQSASVNVAGSSLEDNHIAVVTTDGSDVLFQSSKLRGNEVAVLDYGENHLKMRNSQVQENKFGVVSKEVPPDDVKASLAKNEKNLDQGFDHYVETLGEEPTNPYADGMKLVNFKKNENRDSLWKRSGNLGLTIGYHEVLTRHHHSSVPYESNNGVIEEGELYPNVFQVDGVFANWNANILMESPDGRTFEFGADISNDTWDRFAIHSVQAIYTDRYQHAALGDIYMNAGPLYMEGIKLFGGSYDLNIYITSPKTPMFEITAFGGEYRAPKLEGKKNYDIFMDYVEEGEAEAQEMVAGGKIRWNMHSRFNGTLGFIGSKDFLEDPLLRNGMDASTNTATPVLTSHNFFADGNWLFFPGDVKLNGQVAVGAADTANAAKIRAINEAFVRADLSPSNYGLLNKLMKNMSEIDNLTSAQLTSIFGENSPYLTDHDKREALKLILEDANKIAKTYKDEDVRPVHQNFWSYDHWAVAGSYEWSNENTFIEGYLRYVGSGYYSAGSQDLQQNTRRIGGNLRQKITDFWKLGFGYTLNIENAARDSGAYNIFGMAEGSEWGLTPGADEEWLEKHKNSKDRTLYNHDAYLGNEFKINNKIGLSAKYSVNYRTRSTAQKLFCDYEKNSGVYLDPWFKPKKGDSVIVVYDTLEVDAKRVEQFSSLKNDNQEQILADQFEERLLKHTFDLGLTFKFPNNVLNLGGRWIFRKDYSRFMNDSLIRDIHLQDETYGILGYYFHGTDYFEQNYSVSLVTKYNDIRNSFLVSPRYKIYNRNDMREFEWGVSDNLTMPLSKDFLDMSLNGGVRQHFLSYKEKSSSVNEMELDVEGSASFRVHHTPSLYTDWTVGAVLNYRPDNRSDEYKDAYVSAALNYEF